MLETVFSLAQEELAGTMASKKQVASKIELLPQAVQSGFVYLFRFVWVFFFRSRHI